MKKSSQPSKYEIFLTSEAAWDAMYRAILHAQQSIYWELYIFVDDEVGRSFFDILEAKAKAGVDVKLVIDSVGSFWLSRKRVQSLKKAGVDIQFFHERTKRYRGWWKRLYSRTHRKILVIDENVGFIGGVNIQKQMKDWLDIQVCMKGKVVHSLLRAFAKSYIISGGDKKKVKQLLAYKFRIEQDETEFIYDEPNEQHRSRIRKKYTEALFKARERVILFSPYYFPDKKFLYALWQARKRGIKVDLLIPYRSDIRLTNYVAFTFFNLMHKRGVDIHFTNKMMHGKGVIVDDDWAMVGSSNIEQAGFYDNYEANVRIKDKKVVKKLKRKILQWLQESSKFDKQCFKQRGKWHKANEWLALKIFRLWHGKK